MRALCTALCLLGAAVARGQERHAYALVIGITGYPKYDAPYRLHFADQDAKAFYDFITTPEGGGFPPANVYLLQNEHATRTAINQSIDSLARRAGREDVVYVFFSGHGVTDDVGYGYLMPYDADADLPSDRGIRADMFLEAVRSKIAVKHLVFFIDACYAGAAVAGGLAKGPERNVSATLLQAWDSVRRREGDVSMAFLSARSNQRSYEDSALHHGVFTWYLLKGLGGAADTENTGNRDGIVTAEELNIYLMLNVGRRVQSTLGRTQTPIASPNFVGSLPLEISGRLETSGRPAGSNAERVREHFERGRALANAADATGAMREYREAIRLDPTYASAYNNLGALVSDRGLVDSAIALYRAAVRADPGFATPHYNLGVNLASRGDYNEAIRQYQEAIRLDPSDADSHNNLGVLLRKQGNVDDAIWEYREAIRLAAQHPHAHRNLGLAMLEIGDLPSAVAALREAARYYPDAARVRAEEDSALILQRSLEQRIAAARDSFRQNIETWHQLAFLLHEEAHDFEQAYVLFRDRVRRSPSDLSTQAELAEASFTTGRYSQADSLITRLLGDAGIPPRRRIVLRALEIANLYALGRSSLVPQRLRELADVVAAQQDSFYLSWLFTGTKFLIRRNVAFEAHRAWLLKLLTALERGRRADILAHLPPPRVTARLDWIKCAGDVWCPLNTVNLGHASFNDLEGVYVVWHGGSDAATLRVGQGVINSVLWTLRSDREVQALADRTLYVTWARVSLEQRAGVEKYLVDALNPKLGDRFPYRTAVVANLPW